MKTRDATRQKSMLGTIAAATLLTVSSSALVAAQSTSSGFMPWAKEEVGVAQLQIRTEPSSLTSVPGFAPWAYSRGGTNQEMLSPEHELAAFEVIEGTGAAPLGFRPWDAQR
ncbi:MAG: hypothetical protein ACT4NU_00935 [Chromatiales bacterium]